MADVNRTLTDLLTNLFQNGQGNGAITPQDVRDAIVSLAMPMGSFAFSSAAATAVTTPTWAKAAGTTTSSILRNFTMPSNNRLTYTGTADISAIVVATTTLIASGTTDNIGLAVAYNGAAVKQVQNYAVAAEKNAVGVSHDLTMSTNDYVELFVNNFDTSTNVTVQFGHLYVLGTIL